MQKIPSLFSFLGVKVCKDNMNLQQKVQSYIQKHQLLIDEGQVVVGVSGGTDSVALLHILISLGYRCITAHCNFHLRMEDSNQDENFVRKLAISHSIPFYSIDFETIEYAKLHKMSIEMAARDLRYVWFDEILKNTGAQAVAVAHHADDNIETMLMNLVRGTGLKGLIGMRPRNQNVVRPLLCCTREELENYLVEHGLEHVEDATNQENNYLRNRFRNEIIPLLTEINPAARENLYKTIANLDGNYFIYQQSIGEIIREIVEKHGAEIRFDIEKILNQVHISTVLFELLSPYGFGAVQVEQIEGVLQAESGKIFYSETHRLVKDRNCLIISAKDDNQKESFTISQNTNEIKSPVHLTIRKVAGDESFSPSKVPDCVHIDASVLEYPMEIRRWNEGDVFYPFGMTKKKKLSDYFIDQKFSIPEKEKCWLLVSTGRIVWIIGHRLDNRFRIGKNSREIIEIKLHNETID